MQYTTDDLNNIRDAKRKLAAGERVGEFRHNGILIRYAEVTLKDLTRMEAEILRALKPRQRRVMLTTSKGL